MSESKAPLRAWYVDSGDEGTGLIYAAFTRGQARAMAAGDYGCDFVECASPRRVPGLDALANEKRTTPGYLHLTPPEWLSGGEWLWWHCDNCGAAIHGGEPYGWDGRDIYCRNCVADEDLGTQWERVTI